MRTCPSESASRRARFLAPLRPFVAAVVVAAAAAVVAAEPATAAEPLPMTLINPSTGGRTGNEFVRPTLQLSASCPAATTTFYARLHGGADGSRFPEPGGLIKVPGYLGMSLTEPFAVEAGFTFLDTAQEAGFSRLAGRYRVEVVCQDDFSTVLRSFVTGVRFETSHTWVAERRAAAAGSSGATVTPTPAVSEPAVRSAEPSAVSASEPTIEARDATGVPLGPSPTVREGQTVRVTAGGFAPGQRVQGSFGTGDAASVETIADGNGVVTYGVTVPGGAGRQTFTIGDGSGRRTLSYRVAADAPAGVTPSWRSRPVIAGSVGLVLLLLAGLVLLAGRANPPGRVVSRS